MMKFIITCDSDDHEVKYESKENSSASKIMENSGFKRYIARHGYHFSERLAEYVSSTMKNGDGTIHRWIPSEVRSALISLGKTDFNMSTIGDLTYLANMAYADFYPDVLDSEIACIKYAYAVAHDKDGYDGIAFTRWLADIIKKHVTDIKWENYV